MLCLLVIIALHHFLSIVDLNFIFAVKLSSTIHLLKLVRQVMCGFPFLSACPPVSKFFKLLPNYVALKFQLFIILSFLFCFPYSKTGIAHAHGILP